jgi:hypothetical protein
LRAASDPGGLFAAIITTLATSKFHDYWIFPAATWQAVFVIGAILSGAAFLRDVVRALRTPVNIDRLVADMKAVQPGGAGGGGEPARPWYQWIFG